jgi:hypothetical protein
MVSLLEYHISVRHSISASLVFLGLVAVPAFLNTTSHAQINGAPASVTSPGFGGRAVNGPPSSVTSLGPRGYAPNSRVTPSISPHVPHNADAQHRHRRSGEFTPYLYAVPVPYAVDNGAAEDYADGSDNDPNYQGGPTVFDRRGAGSRSYVPPGSEGYPSPSAVAADNSSDPEPAQDPTLLVFKDGRKLEVENYAIVGSTLFDLTSGHPRKVALTDLDLEATQKQNEDRGVIFQLPPSTRVN